MNTIEVTDLKTAMQSENPPLVLDVLSDEHYERVHIQGAFNACVYEVVFLEAVESCVSNKSDSIVLYGLSDEFSAATEAYNRLAEAGYSGLKVLSGGLEGWTSAGLPTAGHHKSIADANLKLKLDTERSVIRWTGRNLVNQHTGTLDVESGNLDLEGGQLNAAELSVSFDSLLCTDISDTAANRGLLGHLKSSDFFETSKFPRAHFRLGQIEPLEGATAGRPNFTVSGELEIKGQSEPVEFPALVTQVGEQWIVQANLDIDRTRWGIRYGSGRFFEALGKHLVNDHINLQVQLFSRP